MDGAILRTGYVLATIIGMVVWCWLLFEGITSVID